MTHGNGTNNYDTIATSRSLPIISRTDITISLLESNISKIISVKVVCKKEGKPSSQSTLQTAHCDLKLKEDITHSPNMSANE